MKIISLEEHFRNAAIEDAVKKALPPSQRDLFVASKALSGPAELDDLGIGRLKHMDAMGIDVQVLSYTTPWTQVLPAAEAVTLARGANDQVASAKGLAITCPYWNTRGKSEKKLLPLRFHGEEVLFYSNFEEVYGKESRKK